MKMAEQIKRRRKTERTSNGKIPVYVMLVCCAVLAFDRGKSFNQSKLRIWRSFGSARQCVCVCDCVWLFVVCSRSRLFNSIWRIRDGPSHSSWLRYCWSPVENVFDQNKISLLEELSSRNYFHFKVLCGFSHETDWNSIFLMRKMNYQISEMN